jgi:hypothetical protein
LLEARADPDLIASRKVCPLLENKTQLEEELRKKDVADLLSYTALHLASQSRNSAGVHLLLEYKANSTLLTSEGFTAFGLAVLSNSRPLSKPIIEDFLKKGHLIDERQGTGKTTGLYYACQFGRLEAVQILLEFKADPCAKHQVKTLLNGYITTTPLSMAASKGFTPLVLELLKYPIPSVELQEKFIPSAEIQRAIQCCPYPDTCEVLRQALCIALNREAVEAHRAGPEHFELAEQLYNRAISEAKSDEEAHSLYYNLGVTLLAMNQLPRARDTFMRCLILREKLVQGPRKNAMLPLLVRVKDKLVAVEERVKNTLSMTA